MGSKSDGFWEFESAPVCVLVLLFTPATSYTTPEWLPDLTAQRPVFPRGGPLEVGGSRCHANRTEKDAPHSVLSCWDAITPAVHLL